MMIPLVPQFEMAFAFSTLVLLVAWLAVYSHGFPVLDQPIYEAPGLPKVDIYYQGGVTSHFDKQVSSSQQEKKNLLAPHHELNSSSSL